MDAEKELAELMRDPWFAQGYQIRKEVMGVEAVERDQTTRLNDEFQRPMWEFGVRAYGMLWTRPGLSRRERSIATLSAMVANQTLEELKVHTRNAVHNGLTAAEIGEVLLHGAIYSGFPKATAAFRVAREVLDEPETKKIAEENARNMQVK
jgi:alkylhydroperoxidase/carboxymuconolactone decarboxylase family protein YurZ